ncbi:hypothetical protein VKT23_012202 [Stygiomarasmius scandens]
MQDPEIRELTASEELSLEEEFDMQRKWREDEDKLTFIILARGPPQASIPPNSMQPPEDIVDPNDPRLDGFSMVGDVNLFFSGTIPSLNNAGKGEEQDDEAEEFTAEAEIMIAEPAYRRQGLAFEALQLMLCYATGCYAEVFSSASPPRSESDSVFFPKLPNPVPPTSLLTRISETNAPSISLFEKLGFRVTKRVEVFKEVEMRWCGASGSI